MVRLHWTDQPYIWHVNDGPEVFAVLDGMVDMKFGDRDAPTVRRMNPGDIFCAADGDAHVAHPVGAARVLVVERKGSV
jgi:mannose-6-phosphate isomerase-like protein (cupin superfamily)